MINTANQAIELDCRDVKKLFMKLKDKGFFNRAVKIKLYDEEIDENLLKSEHFMDKIHYYRVIKRLTKVDMAKCVGIDDYAYAEYESKKNQLSNVEYAERFIERLGIKNELELPDYYKFMKEYPTERIVNYIRENYKGATDFSKICNLNPATIQSWLKNKNLKISLSSYQKLLECWQKNFNYSIKN